MLSAILIAAMPFVLNFVMGFAKQIGAQDFSTPGKRFLLAFLALVGVIAANVFSGVEVDPNQISIWVTILLESLAAFIAAHGSYVLFWKKTPAVTNNG